MPRYSRQCLFQLLNKSPAQVSDTESEYEGDGSAATQKGRTKKMKGVPYSELVAQREVRRKERREEHKDRPKTIYKGLTWHVTKSGKESWHVQVWTGKTVSPSTPS